jgi:hypothetical protein
MVKTNKTDKNRQKDKIAVVSYVSRMFLVATCCLVSVPKYMYIHSSLMWGQCSDVVQLQFVDCGLVEGLIDLFGVKTCTWPVF